MFRADAAEVRRRAHPSEGGVLSAAEDVIDEAREVAHAVPISLSPSSMGTFTSCPLAFRFGYIERLPEPPSAPASKGTLVHLALQHLMWRPPVERTLDAALADLGRAEAELAADPEFAELELSDEERALFRADADVLVRRYFELEDPRDVTVLGVELRVTATTGAGVTIRGIIDRLELGPDGELVVTDYKTGSAPSEGWEQRSLAGVHVYSLLCERMFGRRPARVQLLYLSKPERIVTAPSDQSLRGVEVKTNAVMRAVRHACQRDDFRPRPSALCNYCNFQEFCPAFDGQPELARPTLLARQAERDGRPQLPLVFA
jgi:putative RecB family exonuclease